MDYFNLVAKLPGNLGEAGKAVRCPRRILDIVQEQGSAAIDLEVEITAVSARLDEELDTAIQVDALLVLRVPGKDITVGHEKSEMQGIAGIKQLGAGKRPMGAAGGMKFAQLNRLGLAPKGAFPRLCEGRVKFHQKQCVIKGHKCFVLRTLLAIRHRYGFSKILYATAIGIGETISVARKVAGTLRVPSAPARRVRKTRQLLMR